MEKAAGSKLEAGLHTLSVASGEGMKLNIQPEMHMAEACRLIWRQQAVQIILLEHGVRAAAAGVDDPEYVHDIRVAIRRARAAHELFGHYFRPRDVKPILGGLRRLGKLLGRVRDLDVAIENLKTYAAEFEGDEERVAGLERATQRQRETALAALMQWLDSEEHASLVASFMVLATSPGMGVRRSTATSYLPQPIQVRHCMPSTIVDRFERVRAYESLLDSATAAAEAPADQLHALRIQCKYLRYALEFNRHLLGKEGEELIGRLKQMQDHLGELNDCTVEVRRLSRLDVDEDTGAIVQLRLVSLAQQSARLRKTFQPVFAAFVRWDNRRLLGEAIAKL